MIPAADFDTRLTALERAMADRKDIVNQMAELRVTLARLEEVVREQLRQVRDLRETWGME